MFFVFLFILIVFILWAIVLYVRKSHWDTIHRNLLDLEDHFEGKVIRRGFAARPFFHGKVKGYPFTLNISTERLKDKRMNYVDISWDLPAGEALTISELEWLKKQRENNTEGLTVVEAENGKKFAFIHKNKKRLEQIVGYPVVKDFINHFEELCYVFLSKNGLICEFSTDNLARATEFESLNKRLDLLKKLGEAFKQ
ncbi:hypothetical protein Calab_1914 [Caldithrix abyssi DSM 13497]|uniref:Uncharacterized protein n=1 Tax=Caldithrix abyssi DSM 13497 TaxID=880073 RepID=H1XTQ3_CALAY|nr:hypothetical protein [Caldithrix abyssi]APF17426.1 hypothetical protein Cabys_675 [Caldithrix abyssi DSM 13497]EHO41528.1 hypothetical protein Calab_1914 [Caldithrix abyssi DSM 13497]